MAIKENLNIEFQRFDETTVDLYENLILGNVYDQLLMVDDFRDESLLAVAAIDAGGKIKGLGAGGPETDKPVGAIVCQVLYDNEIFVHSIFVDEKYRKSGIGKELFLVVLDLASELFGPSPKLIPPEGVVISEDEVMKPEYLENAETIFVVNESLHIDFALPKEEHEGFTEFLKKVGFTDFTEKEPLYIFEKRDLEVNALTKDALSPAFTKSDDVYYLGETAGEFADEVTAFLDSMGIVSEVDYATYTVEGEEANFLMLVSYGTDGDFYITSQLNDVTAGAGETDEGAQPDAVSKAPSDEQVLSCLKASINAISKENENFALLVDMTKNTNQKLWASIANEAGETCPRTEAGMYVTINY